MADTTHHAKMVAAFDLVENADHWKGPVDGFIDGADVAVVAEAVVYFTATVAEITEGPTKGRFHVKAPGYWAGPAA